jgi:hypothetical protein
MRTLEHFFPESKHKSHVVSLSYKEVVSTVGRMQIDCYSGAILHGGLKLIL